MLEEWLNVLEKRDLLFNGIATSLRDIYEIQNASVQVGESSD